MSQSVEEKSPDSLCSSLSVTGTASIFCGWVRSLSFLPNPLRLDASPLLPAPGDLLWTDVGGTEDSIRGFALRKLRPSAVTFVNISAFALPRNLNLPSLQP